MRIIKAKTLAGEPITIEFEDLGDAVPAYDKNGFAFEAYTSHFKGPDWEEYVQVDRRSIERDVYKRLKRDYAALRARGIDTDSIEIEI